MTTLHLIVGLIPSFCVIDKQNEPQPLISVDEVRTLLSRDFDLETMRGRLAAWKKAPAYQVISNAERILPFLLEEQATETMNYRWQQGTHDLNQVAGRAAWALDELLGIKLTLVTPDGTRTRVMQVHREAEVAFQASFAWAVKAAENLKQPKRLEGLKAKYRGRIKAGITFEKSPTYQKTMREFLLEWPPLGQKISELQEIIGEAGAKKGEVVTFRFDSGRGGFDYKFRTKDGVIRSVLIVSLD